MNSVAWTFKNPDPDGLNLKQKVEYVNTQAYMEGVFLGSGNPLHF